MRVSGQEAQAGIGELARKSSEINGILDGYYRERGLETVHLETDRRAGKRTLAVRLGLERTRTLFAVIVYASYLLAPITWLFGPLRPWLLLSWLTLPVGAQAVRTVRNHVDGPSLNAALAQTGVLALAFCMLLSAGLLLSR